MKVKYLKLKNWMIVTAGSLLGVHLVGCEGVPEPDMYGSPETTFRVKGTVADADGHPIAGIGVGSFDMSQTGPDGVVVPGIDYRDTTDAEGRFDVSYRDFSDTETIRVDFHDIDGEQNGSYRPQVENVSFRGAEFRNQSATREIEVTLQRDE